MGCQQYARLFVNTPGDRWAQFKTTYSAYSYASIITAQRGHALHLLKVTDLKMYRNKSVIHSSNKLKHTRPEVHTQSAEILEFAENRKLCLVDHLRVYLEKTGKLRREPELFISVVKQHVPVSQNSFSQWVKMVLKDTGADTEKFGSHTT